MSTPSILVPLDQSELAEVALPYAEAVSVALQVPLRLFAVASEGGQGLVSVSPELLISLKEMRHRSLAQYLSGVCTRLHDWGLSVSTGVVDGDPAEQILAAAGRDDVRMIVMATHGRGGLQRWLIGSVADKVMRLSSRPTLLVTPLEPGQAAVDVHLRRLMVPLDGSALAEAALPPAVELARAAHATLLLVRVEQSATAISGGHDFVPDIAFWDEEVTKLAHAYLGKARTLVSADVPVELAVARGPVAPRLHDLVAERQVDLIVMSTRGQGGMRRMMLGSVADRLVRSGVPVLLVPPTTVERTGQSDLETDLVATREG